MLLLCLSAGCRAQALLAMVPTGSASACADMGAAGQPKHPRGISSRKRTSVWGESTRRSCVCRGFVYFFSLMLQLYNKSFPPKFGVDIAGGLLLPVAAAMARFAVLYAA